jgi:hypothetical protein
MNFAELMPMKISHITWSISDFWAVGHDELCAKCEVALFDYLQTAIWGSNEAIGVGKLDLVQQCKSTLMLSAFREFQVPKTVNPFPALGTFTENKL